MNISRSNLNEGGLVLFSEKVHQKRFTEGESLKINSSETKIAEWKGEKRKMCTNSKWDKLRK